MPRSGPFIELTYKRQTHNDRSKHRQHDVGDRIGHSNAKNRRLTLRDIARAGDGGVDSHCTSKGTANDNRVHAQYAMRKQRADNQGRQSDDHAHAEQEQPVRLNRGQSGRSTCESNGGDKSAEAEIAEGLLRLWRERSHRRSA